MIPAFIAFIASGAFAVFASWRILVAESRANAAELAATYHRDRADKLEADIADHNRFVGVLCDQRTQLEDALYVARATHTRLHRRAQRSESECATLRREAVGLWRVISHWRSESKRLGWGTDRDPVWVAREAEIERQMTGGAS